MNIILVKIKLATQILKEIQEPNPADDSINESIEILGDIEKELKKKEKV